MNMSAEDWDYHAKRLGFPNMRALLIKHYILDGRPNGWLQSYLGTSRWTVIKLLKEARIEPHGNRSVYLVPLERTRWEKELSGEGTERV